MKEKITLAFFIFDAIITGIASIILCQISIVCGIIGLLNGLRCYISCLRYIGQGY